MSRIKGVLFDFDGTLTELTIDFGNMRAEVEEIALRYVSEETVAAFQGRFILEMVFAIEEHLGDRGPEFKKKAFRLLKELELAAAKGKGVYPYTRDVLSRLRQEGVRVGIITRSCVDVLKSVFPDMDEYVEAIVDREYIREVKPHPRHVLAAAHLLSIAPGEGLVVGDHPTDVEAGRAAGMDTAAVLTGRTGRADFEKAGAGHILEDIRGIPDLIDGTP